MGRSRVREVDDSKTTDVLEDKVVHITRTAKVVKGGRRFGFSATVVVGDKRGKVGYGKGKAAEVPIAIQKALEQAKKNMTYIPLAGTTIHHKIVHSFGASKIVMLPASDGTGIIAGGAMRAVLEVLGVQNILAKSIGSTNPNNVVRATIDALKLMATPDIVAAKRSKTVEEVTEG